MYVSACGGVFWSCAACQLIVAVPPASTVAGIVMLGGTAGDLRTFRTAEIRHPLAPNWFCASTRQLTVVAFAGTVSVKLRVAPVNICVHVAVPFILRSNLYEMLPVEAPQLIVAAPPAIAVAGIVMLGGAGGGVAGSLPPSGGSGAGIKPRPPPSQN